MKLNELLGQPVMFLLVFTEERPQGEGTMGRRLLFNRNANLEWRVLAFAQRCEALPKTTRSGEEICDSEAD